MSIPSWWQRTTAICLRDVTQSWGTRVYEDLRAAILVDLGPRIRTRKALLDGMAFGKRERLISLHEHATISSRYLPISPTLSPSSSFFAFSPHSAFGDMSSPPPKPPDGGDVNRGWGVSIFLLVITAIGTVLTILRLYTRIFVLKRLGWDDCFNVLGLVCDLG